MSLPQRLSINWVDSVYDSALDGDFFNGLLDLLHRLLPQTAVILYSQDAASTVSNYVMHRNLGRDAARSYALEIVADNPWFEAQWAMPLARPYQDHQLLEPDVFRATTFYQAWLSKQGGVDDSCGLVLSRRGTRQVVLEIRFDAQANPHLRSQITDILDALAPHLVRAMRIFQMRYNHPFERSLSANLLELFCFPAALLAADCRVVSLNGRAEQLFQSKSPMFLTADGHLHASDANADLRFRAAVQRLALAPRRGVELSVLRNEARGGGRYFVSMVTLGHFGNADYREAGVSEHQGRRVAMVVQDSADALRVTHDSLWRVFGLTPAESDLARSLLEGHTIAEIALLRKVSKQTLRNHLVSIMRKTGTSRQPQLLALLTRIALSTAD